MHKTKTLSATPSRLLEDINFKSQYNMKQDKELVIGNACRSFIVDGNSGLREKVVSDMKQYFQAVCGYLISNLLL